MISRRGRETVLFFVETTFEKTLEFNVDNSNYICYSRIKLNNTIKTTRCNNSKGRKPHLFYPQCPLL